MNKTLGPNDMEAFARALQSAKQAGRLSPEEADYLHGRFIAEDSARTQWTIGIQSLKWHQRVNGKWVPGVPPADLSLPLDLVLVLQALMTADEPAAPLPPPPTPPPAASRTCANCRASLLEGQQFCPVCGARAGVSAAVQSHCENPACRQPFSGNEAFCSHCGQRRGAPARIAPIVSPRPPPALRL